METAKFSDILDVGWEKKREVKDDLKGLGLSSLKAGVALTRSERTMGETGVGVGSKKGNEDQEQRQIYCKANEA